MTEFLVPAGVPAGKAMRELDLPSKGPDAVVCVKTAAGDLKDLSYVPEADETMSTVIAASEEG
ncbi:hypothetical protein, partial [Corynebacterium pyruviciproducens]